MLTASSWRTAGSRSPSSRSSWPRARAPDHASRHSRSEEPEMMRRRGGLVRMAATTAVVAGTAGAVSHHQQQKYAQQSEAQAYEQEQAAAAAAPPPQANAPAPAAPPVDPQMAQLQNLANLHAQGILSDEEFAAAKAKALGI